MRGVGKDGVERHFNLAFRSEKFQQHGNSFLGRENPGDHSSQSAERSFHQINFISGPDAGFKDDGLLIADRLAEGGDHVFGNHGDMFSEADDFDDATSGLDFSVLGIKGKPGKDIAWKHRLGDPGFSLPSGAFETDQRAKNLNVDLRAQQLTGRTLILWTGVQAVPLKIIGHI